MTPIGDVPNGWKVVRLDDIADVVGGSTPSRTTKEYWNGPISWVVPSEVSKLSGRYISSSSETITEEGFKSAGLQIVPSNSILLTSRATIGELAINTIPLTTNQGFQNVVVKNPTDILWLYYRLTAMRQELRARAAGSTFREISRDSIRSLPILLPPLKEQCAIAEVLNSVDETIELTESVALLTQRLRDAILRELLTCGIPGKRSKSKEISGFGICPANWDVVKLSELLALDQPGTWGSEPTLDDPGVRVLRAADLTTDGKIDPGGIVSRRVPVSERSRRLLQDGDLVLERSGGGPGRPVGRVAIVDDLGQLYCSNFCQQLRVDRTHSRSRYIFWALQYRYLCGITSRLEHRTTGIRNLDYTGYLRFPIPLPSLDEQDTIVGILDSVDTTLQHIRVDILPNLGTARLAVSEALLTGRIRAGA